MKLHFSAKSKSSELALLNDVDETISFSVEESIENDVDESDARETSKSNVPVRCRLCDMSRVGLKK